MNKLVCAHASSADSGTDTSPHVCMARRPAAVREQRSTQLGTFSPCLFCMLFKPWLWGMFNDWFIWENNTGEKWHLPLSTVSFLLHSLTCSLEICTRVYFLSKRKQVSAHDCLCTLSALHALTGFLRVQDRLCSPCPFQRHNGESRLWLEISLESSSVFGSPCCSVLLQDPGTIGTIRHAVLFEQQYLVTMERLRQLLYVLCNRTNGSHS